MHKRSPAVREIPSQWIICERALFSGVNPFAAEVTVTSVLASEMDRH
jgi:hypothetical protein